MNFRLAARRENLEFLLTQIIVTPSSLIILSLLVYLFAIFGLFHYLEAVVAIFSLLPAATIGYYFGTKIGFASGLAFLPINWILLKFIGFPLSLLEFAIESSLVGSTAVGCVAAGIGYIAQLNRRLQQEVKGREQAQDALNKLNGQLQIQAKQALQARSHFLTAMSHKLRTPLNASVGMSTLLLDTELDAKQSEYVHDVLCSNTEIIGIINSILEYTKVESGEIELNTTKFELTDLLEEIRQVVQSKVDEKGIILHTEIDPQVPQFLRGDRQKFALILHNLVHNALDATEDGQITITARLAQPSDNTNTQTSHSATTVQVQIADTGMGIHPSNLNMLFEPFGHAYETTTQVGVGVGIGLALCRRLCRRMGGDIWVDSKIDQGTTVTLMMPFELATTSELATTGQHSAVSHRRNISDPTADQTHTDKNLKILLAEDNTLNAKVVLKMLEKLNYSAQWVKDGQAAVEAMTETNYELVLMDIQMPRLDGLQATQQIRKHLRGSNSAQPHPYIIALTADTTLEDFSKQKAYGFDGFISKPVSLQMLEKALRTSTASAKPSMVRTPALP